MVRELVRRVVALALALVVGAGGGRMPSLDALVAHGPSRLVESLQSHYETASDCHGDACSIGSDVQPRILGHLPPRAPAAGLVEQAKPAPLEESAPQSTLSLSYLSRAPPLLA